MGSKKAILPFVARELERLTKPGDILVDLMAGTHTIGYVMKQRCRIVANDIQRYSLVIGHTLLNYKPEPRFEGNIRTVFLKYFQTNLRHLSNLFEQGLRREKRMLTEQEGRKPNWVTYRDFCEGYPYFMRPTPAVDWHEEFLLLFSAQRIKAYRTLNKLEPYSLFSLYFANGYVGVRQAIEIDSLRYAIDKLCDEWVDQDANEKFDSFGLRCLLLSSLLSVINRINPGPGHWAAVPRVNQRNRDYLCAYRRINVYDLFIRKVADFETQLALYPSEHGPHIAMTEDYLAFMSEVVEYIRKAKVVYLDPPYSQGHYSRFYHLLETMTQYDYPEIAFAGRYRTDRHQSPFAQKDKVAGAIGHVCEMSRDANTTLVISYSKGGIIPESDAFRSILEKHYPSKKIRLKKLTAQHSKFGQSDRMRTVEYLFTCSP